MKNENVYNKYSIKGFPCYFFTVTCADLYNEKIEKFCKKLPNNAEDLSFPQKIYINMYIYLFLLGYDCWLSMIEHISKKN